MPRRKKQPKEPKEVKTTIRGKKNVVQTVVVKVGETKRRGRRRRSAPKQDVMMRELPPPVIYQTGPAQIPAPVPAPPAPPAPNVPPAFAAEAQAQQLLGVGLAGTHDILRRQIESLRGGQPNEIVEPVMEGVSQDIPFVSLVEAVPTVSEKKPVILDKKPFQNLPLEEPKRITIRVPRAPVEFQQPPVSGHLSLVEPNIHNNAIAQGEVPTPRTPGSKKGKFSEPIRYDPTTERESWLLNYMATHNVKRDAATAAWRKKEKESKKTVSIPIDINAPLGKAMAAVARTDPNMVFDVRREPQSNLFVAPREEEKKQQQEVMQQTGLPF